MEALKPGTAVERGESPDKYIVPAGTRGVVKSSIDATSYFVQWDGRQAPDFAAASRIRPQTA